MGKKKILIIGDDQSLRKACIPEHKRDAVDLFGSMADNCLSHQVKQPPNSTDNADHKTREDQLARLNQMLKAHSDSSQALMHCTDESSYLQQVCRIIAEDCGYAMTWIGYAEHDERKSVRPVAFYGFEAGYLETLKLTWDNTERGRGPTGTAIRTAKPCACRNMLRDPEFEPWRQEAMRRGYASSLAVPLVADGEALGAITVYSSEPDCFSEEETRLLDELADDVAFGITTLRLKEQRAKAERELQEQNAKLLLISDAVSKLLISEDPQEVINELCTNVMHHLNCQVFFNYLVDGETSRLHLNAYSGIPEEVGKSIEWLEYGVAVCGCAAQSGCRIIAENIPTVKDPRTDLVASFGMKAYACHPLLSRGGQVIGTLSFGTSERETFEENEIALMKTIADHVAIAMERIVVQKELQEVAQRLNSHMENSPLAVVEWDRDYKIIRWSDEAEQVFGWSLEEVLGKRIDDFHWVHEDDWSIVAELMEDMNAGVRQRNVNPNRNYRKDGSIIYCEWYNSVQKTEAGDVASILSLVLDVTNREEAKKALHEAREHAERHAAELESFISNMADGVILFNAEGKAISMNDAGRRILGLPDASLPDEWRGCRHLTMYDEPIPASETAAFRSQGRDYKEFAL